MSVITSSLSMMDISDPEIQVSPLSITKNGTYTAPLGSAYNPVNVEVVEEPWQPLEDGYSNFWFELTNDTLSPWLNFSAKNANATIDWGDGSGEVALDTLTPTHTYAKAGRYVVKVKGVTGICNQQGLQPFRGAYFSVLKYVELNNEVTTTVNVAFRYCTGIKNIITDSALTSIGASSYQFCTSLQSTVIPDGITALASGVYASCINLLSAVLPTGLTSIGLNCFNTCISLTSITIPSTVTEIGGTAFSSCYSLSEIHCQPTTPPTIGVNTFYSLPSDYIIYVPAGTGDTYKAASGWSNYADHILEEGQTPNRAMLAKLDSAEPGEEEEKPDDNER